MFFRVSYQHSVKTPSTIGKNTGDVPAVHYHPLPKQPALGMFTIRNISARSIHPPHTATNLQEKFKTAGFSVGTAASLPACSSGRRKN